MHLLLTRIWLKTKNWSWTVVVYARLCQYMSLFLYFGAVMHWSSLCIINGQMSVFVFGHNRLSKSQDTTTGDEDG